MGYKITGQEVKSQLKFILIGACTLYLVGPLREVLKPYVDGHEILLGVLGIIVVLYLFDFSQWSK